MPDLKRVAKAMEQHGMADPAYRHPRDDRGEVRLFEIDHGGLLWPSRHIVVRGYRLVRFRERSTKRPDASTIKRATATARHQECELFGSQMGSFACSSAFNSTRSVAKHLDGTVTECE